MPKTVWQWVKAIAGAIVSILVLWLLLCLLILAWTHIPVKSDPTSPTPLPSITTNGNRQSY